MDRDLRYGAVISQSAALPCMRHSVVGTMSKKNGNEALSRRAFLASAATIGASAMAAPALAQSALDGLLNAPKRGNWDDQFDAKAASRTATAVVSNTPILGPQSVASAQQAIMQYQQIAAAGGSGDYSDPTKWTGGVSPAWPIARSASAASVPRPGPSST